MKDKEEFFKWLHSQDIFTEPQDVNDRDVKKYLKTTPEFSVSSAVSIQIAARD